MVSNVQTYAYQLVGLAFASSSEAPRHTGPVIKVVRSDQIKLNVNTYREFKVGLRF